MKQYEAVIKALENSGGMATLGQLNQEVFKIKDCDWKTKTPFASIRRIVQTNPSIYKIKPGLWALTSHRKKLEARGILSEEKQEETPQSQQFDHTYYQGILLILGNLKQLSTFAPNQDKNRLFLQKKLFEVRSLQSLPPYSYPELVKRSSTVDAIWFNNRNMPHSFFEVEASTDFYNSFLKFVDLQDFNARMIVVADDKRRAEFESKISHHSFEIIKSRVKFQSYAQLVKQYENAVEASKLELL